MKRHIPALSMLAALCATALSVVPVTGGAAASDVGRAAAFPAAGVTLELTVGEQRALASGRALQRVAVGDPAVADVLVVKGERQGSVLLIGKAEGTTSVMLWERGSDTPRVYTVSVVQAAARALLGSDTGEVAVLGGKTVISGTATTMEKHQRAAALAGYAASKDGKDGKDDRAASIIDTSTIATRPVVQVDVRVIEFSRAVLKEIGFNFFKQNNGFSFGSFAPSALTSTNFTSGGAQVQATMPISSAFNLVFGSMTHDLFANLSIMESNDLARVLAEPTLVALSGQSASFLAGGEIPVPVPEALGTTSIEYKPYGVGLTLTPTVLSPQRIALKIAPEASELDFIHAVTVNGISVPAITTRRADTTVELGDGESFVIGGLIDRETASNVSKVPVLGDLPIIGAFFKQLSYQQTDKELVIVVTPHLVSPLAKGAALPDTPGARSEQRDGPVWRSLLGGAFSNDAAPGFSK